MTPGIRSLRSTVLLTGPSVRAGFPACNYLPRRAARFEGIAALTNRLADRANPVARKGYLRDSPSDPCLERRWQVATDPGMHPGYVLLSNGLCCDDKIYMDLGQTAELAAWWQHNRAASGDVITVGAIIELAIPVDTLRRMHPVRGSLSPDWPEDDGFEGWEDPGPPPGR
jgi:hypothetical protein